MKKVKTILGIDRGSKYIGLATVHQGDHIVMPMGYIYNDKMVYFNIADTITRYHVSTIVLGYPSKQKDIQGKIDQFINSLGYIIDKEQVVIEKVDEDYTSVESGEILSNFKKNAAEDTVSAMKILERRLKEKENPQA